MTPKEYLAQMLASMASEIVVGGGLPTYRNSKQLNDNVTSIKIGAKSLYKKMAEDYLQQRASFYHAKATSQKDPAQKIFFQNIAVMYRTEMRPEIFKARSRQYLAQNNPRDAFTMFKAAQERDVEAILKRLPQPPHNSARDGS